MYSSQPLESITIRLEAVGSVTVYILPFHSFCRAVEIPNRTWSVKPDGSIQNENLQGFAGPDFKRLANFLRDDHLIFRRDCDRFGCHREPPTEILSIQMSYVNISIDHK